MKIKLTDPIEAVKWPRKLFSLIDSKPLFFEKLWDIYANDALKNDEEYVGKGLLEFSGITEEVYDEISAVLKQNGLPDLSAAPALVELNDALREAQENELTLIPSRTVVTDKDLIKIYSLGTFPDGVYEIVYLEQGRTYPIHVHHNASTKIRIIHGKGQIVLDGRVSEYAPGMSFWVTKGVFHGFHVDDETLLLSIQDEPISDPQSGKTDIRYK